MSSTPELDRKVFYNRNFGHDGPEVFNGVGINGKMSEFHAAVGLVNLRHFEDIVAHRRECHDRYDEALRHTAVTKLTVPEGTEWNCSYYPVLFQSEAALLRAFQAMKAEGITARRYFYPSLDTLDYVQSSDLPVAHDVTRRVACLPLMYQLTAEDIERVSAILQETA